MRVLAVLALTLDDMLTRLNALKQGLSLRVSIADALFFVFAGQVEGLSSLVIAVGALAGGATGGRPAGSDQG